MNLCLDEASIIEHGLQFLRRIGRHALHDVRPHGVTIYDLHHDGELTARLQHTTHLLQTIRQIGPEIHRFYSRYKVELPVLVREFLG